MLDLYHAEPGANSLKVLIAFKEKEVPFTSHYVNLHKFEQHSDWFKKINPNGQVPALSHDGKVIVESTVINEYLDDIHPEKPLRPADPYWRARMRIWTKFVDEYMCPAISYIAWNSFIHNLTDQLTPEEFEEKLKQIPLKEQQDKWRIAAKQGYTKEQLDNWARQVQTSYQKIEAQLGETKFLAGDQFTLADVSVAAMSVGISKRPPTDDVNEKKYPRFFDWDRRISDRKGVKDALAMPNLTDPNAWRGSQRARASA
ncbi:MAG: glutathione S-transferase family protein [Alphaproteobacteria bacterium]